MATRDIDGGAAYLSRLLVRSHPNAEQLETELEKCFNEIQRQITVSRTIRKHFKFIQLDDPFKNAGAGERVVLLTNFRHSATTTKEVLLRSGTRFIFTERIYALQARCTGVSSVQYDVWLAKDWGFHKIGVINMTTEMERRPLIGIMKQADELLAKAEKDLEKDGLKDASQQPMGIDENVSKFQQLLKEQTKEIRSLKARLSSLETCMNNAGQHGQEGHQTENFPHQPEQNLEITDDENLSKLIEKTMILSAAVRGSPVQVHVQRALLTQGTSRISDAGESMEYAIRRFPYCRLAAYSKGAEPQRPCSFCGAQFPHFPDSCPIARDVHTRNQIVQENYL